MGNCQNYGPFLGPYYNTGPNTGPNLGDPKRDHNFDNPPCQVPELQADVHRMILDHVSGPSTPNPELGGSGGLSKNTYNPYKVLSLGD